MRFGTLIGISFLVFTLIGLSSSELHGQAMRGSGTVTYVPDAMEMVELSDGTMLQRSYLRGVVLASDPSVPFHLSAQDCPGSSIVSAEGQVISGYGYCEGTDRDGDMWWIWWKNSPTENTWGFMGGRGKYAGIEGGGTTAVQSQYPDGRLVISWNGSWRMKR